ncbi:MAG: carboxypeptidase regulatory-like domain-containing protein, partial [Bryobacteraceae bacterium]
MSLALLALSGTAQAQVLYGSLTGLVTDASGAIVPGAAVQALNTGTGVARQATTNEQGIYLFSDLQPGVYSVTVSAKSFTKVVNEGVTITANRAVRVDAALQVGQITESIQVSVSAIMLQTERADVNTQVDQVQLNNLPMTSSAGRNFQALYKFVPGFSMVTEGISSDGGNPQRTMTGNVNGNSFQSNNVKIDGVSNSYIWLPFNSAYVPPTEGIESVSIVTNSADAEQGNVAGASVNVITKSGGNAFHGSAFEDHTDRSLKAQNLFQTFGTAKPAYIFNQYGASLGGPVRKNRIFFFGDWEGLKRRQRAAPVKTVINPAAIFDGSGNANLSAGAAIYDPSTGNPDGTGRTQFAGNIIPAARIDPASKTILGRINAGGFLNSVGPTATNNYLAGGSTQMNRDTGDAKVNWVPSDRLTVFGRYSISQATLVDPPVLGLAMGGASGGGQVGTAPSRIQNVGAGLTYTISSSMLIDANAGYIRQRLGATYAPDLDLGNFGLNTLHIAGTNGNTYLAQGTPAFIVTGWNSMGNSDTGNPFLFRDNQYLYNINFGWMTHSHSLRFGFENGRDGINHFQPQGGAFQTPRGSFRFIGNVTALKGGAAATPANSLAQFLLGLPDEVGKAVQNAIPNSLRWRTYSFYARDAWQVSSKLTITYGL